MRIFVIEHTRATLEKRDFFIDKSTGINRTIMELKHFRHTASTFSRCRINRTIMEFLSAVALAKAEKQSELIYFGGQVEPSC